MELVIRSLYNSSGTVSIFTNDVFFAYRMLYDYTDGTVIRVKSVIPASS